MEQRNNRSAKPVLIFWIFLCALIASGNSPGVACAGGPVAVSVSMGGTHLFGTDLEGGGRLKMSQAAVASSVMQPVGERVSIGFGLDYMHREYRFSNPVFTGGVRPFSDLQSLQASFVYLRTLDTRWHMQVSPSFRYAGETGARSSDSLGWGGVVSFSRQVSPDLVLGLGIAYADNIGKRRAVPLVTVQWNVTERLTVANSPRTGPWGPAGLEASYRLNKQWVMAGGAAWHSQRYRLDKHGYSSGGAADLSGVPGWIRVSRSFPGGLGLDIYGGAVFSGRLRVDDSQNNRMAAADYSTAPFISTSLSMRF